MHSGSCPVFYLVHNQNVVCIFQYKAVFRSLKMYFHLFKEEFKVRRVVITRELILCLCQKKGIMCILWGSITSHVLSWTIMRVTHSVGIVAGEMRRPQWCVGVSRIQHMALVVRTLNFALCSSKEDCILTQVLQEWTLLIRRLGFLMSIALVMRGHWKIVLLETSHPKSAQKLALHNVSMVYYHQLHVQ